MDSGLLQTKSLSTFADCDILDLSKIQNIQKEEGQALFCPSEEGAFISLMDKYKLKKLKNQELISYIVTHISDTSLNRISVCGEFLVFMANDDLSKKKLHSGNFCENRFCPMCAWRQAKKDALKISVLMKYIEFEHKKDFVLLTLTAPNVTGDKLSDEITRYNLAFKNLMKRKEVLPVNKGYIRKLEITYNKQKKTYHTHFHVLIAVNQSYFKDRTYLKQDKWLNMWRDVMDAPEITQVDVRRIKKGESGSEVREISKYAAKDSDMMVSQEVFDTFYEAIKGRQVITYNGLFKDANKLFKQKKLDNFIDVDFTDYVYFLLYRWGKGEYVQMELWELTEAERRDVNKKMIDEVEVD